MMKKPKLSVVIITLNEEKNLRRCLDSVKFADEIILVDSGSNDNTCAIAETYTDNIFHRKMDGFGAQKQYALDKASGEWILSIDADEWVSDELYQSLESFLKISKDKINLNGYMIYRRNFFLGRPMTYCGWYRPILRLIRNGYGKFDDKLVHEDIHVEGETGLLKGELLHTPYKDLFHYLEKMQRYAKLDAIELIKKRRHISGFQIPVHLILRPLYKFIEKYILQQGFREGRHGLILSGMSAFGVFLMHAQCWYLTKVKKIQADKI